MIGADERTVDARVKPPVRIGGHHRIQEHETAPAAATAAGGYPYRSRCVSPMNAVAAAQVAALDARLRLRGVIEAERGNPLGARVRAD